MFFERIHKVLGVGYSKVPSIIEANIIQALRELGTWEWPQGYEIVRFPGASWAVQSRQFCYPPFGRYEVTVKFIDLEPSYLEIKHSNCKSGTSITRTRGVNYEELIEVLRQSHKEFGPIPLYIPNH